MRPNLVAIGRAQRGRMIADPDCTNAMPMDDDRSVLRALSRLIRTAGFSVLAFDRPTALIASANSKSRRRPDLRGPRNKTLVGFVLTSRPGATARDASDQGPLYCHACDGEYASYRARVVMAAGPFPSSGEGIYAMRPKFRTRSIS